MGNDEIICLNQSETGPSGRLVKTMNNKKTENQELLDLEESIRNDPDWWVKYKNRKRPIIANEYEDAKYGLLLCLYIWVIIILYA